MSVLLLKFVAPMQSWGVGDWYYNRGTTAYPTKSAVVGMLNAALGIERGSENEMGKLNGVPFAVRADHPGVYAEDFQTINFIGSVGKNKVEGSKANGTELDPSVLIEHSITKPFRKAYLMDAVFLVGLEMDSNLAEEVRAALFAPVYPQFLGRKSCPPSEPVFANIVDGGLDEVMLNTPLLKSWREDSSVVRKSVLLVTEDRSGGKRVADTPVSFDPSHRKFASRIVKEQMIDVPVIPEGNWLYEEEPSGAKEHSASPGVRIERAVSPFDFDPITALDSL